MTPMLNCSFSVLGISPMTLGAVVLNCFSNITILKIVTAWAHMRSCRRHMLCCFCSSIRATKQAMSYHAKMLQVLKDNPKLKPVFITLTVKNGDDLGERFNHLMSNFKTMQKAREIGLIVVLVIMSCVRLMVLFTLLRLQIEVGRGWHPHIHMVALQMIG